MRARERTLRTLLVLSLLANIVLLAVALVPANDPPQALSKPGEADPVPTATLLSLSPARDMGNGSAASMQVPVIIQRVEADRGGPFLYEETTEEGAMVSVSVEIVPGKGRVLVQTTPLMGIAFQDAANRAVVVAADHSRVDLAESDVIFSIQGPEDVSEIDGPSAGALMAALVVSVLEDFPLNESVTVTGSIDENGNIGPVGGLLEKAEAARRSGKTLLVLSDESDRMIDYQEQGRSFGVLRIARQRPVVTDAKEYIEENLGIRVEYADTLDDLIAYVRAPEAAAVAAGDS